MLSKLNLPHRLIYFSGIILLAISLPLSIYFTSVAEIIILVNWILEGKFREKWSILRKKKSIWLIAGLYLIHLLGVLYSDLENLDYLMQDLKVKLPILILPVLIGTSRPFNWKEIKLILMLFTVATLSSTLISFGIFIGIIPYEYYDFREISIFISHIRLALMVNLSIFIFIYYIFNRQKKKRFNSVQAFFAILAIFWLIFFLVLLKSLTGLIILGLLILVLGWIYSKRFEDIVPRFIIRTLIIVLPLLAASYVTRSIGKFYYREDVDFSKLETHSELGNPYDHDTLRKATENGNYVWLYVAEEELEDAWNQVSEYKYDGKDRKGQNIKYTLIRYLASRGLRKDASGVSQLTDEDIEAIENGKANHIFNRKYSLYPRIYQVIWEIDSYLRGGDPSGHSVTQRIAYLDAAKAIFQSHPLLGVGTGDVQSSFDNYYEKINSQLDDDYRRRAHNQYVTFLITFGIAGFILVLVFMLMPVFLERKWGDYLFIVFFIIAFMSMMNEDTLETQTGVSFFIFFYSLFLFGREEKIYMKMNKDLLKRTIELAKENIERGGGPFGALIVKDGEVIVEASNSVRPANDPTAHAEILAIRTAAEKLGTHDLNGCELYTSCEPCPMCLGAVYWAHIDKVYYAATHDDARDAGFDDADMYNEMKKVRSDRKIAMDSALREDSLRVFNLWKEKQDKLEY